MTQSKRAEAKERNARRRNQKRLQAQTDAAKPVEYKIPSGIVGGRRARSYLLTRPFKKNSAFGRLYSQRLDEFVRHVAPDGQPTIAQQRIADQLARLTLISDTCWAAVNRDGVLTGGRPTGAFENMMRSVREERAALLLVGLERKSAPVQSLDEYLEQQRENDTIIDPEES